MKLLLAVLFQYMDHVHLSNYLRTARRRLALSQQDIALLLDMAGKNVVSYHERGMHMPTLERALGYTAILGFPAHDLFAGLYQQVEEQIAIRADLLVRELREESTEGLRLRKLESLVALSSSEHNIIDVCQD